MVKYYIHELRYEGKIIGYRVSNRSGRVSFDMPTTFLTYLFENHFNYVIIALGFPIECMLVDDVFISSQDNYMNPIEVESEFDIAKFLHENGVCSFGNVVQNSRVIYRYLVCNKKLLDIGVPLGGVSKVISNPKMHSRWGCCYRRNGFKTFDIEIAERLMLSADYEGIDHVMMHELLHTIQGCFNHGPMWKSWANVVCKAFGYNVKRLTGASELGSDPATLIELGYKACQCVDCGNVIVKKTECEFIRHPERWSCKCGGMFVRIS